MIDLPKLTTLTLPDKAFYDARNLTITSISLFLVISLDLSNLSTLIFSSSSFFQAHCVTLSSIHSIHSFTFKSS